MGQAFSNLTLAGPSPKDAYFETFQSFNKIFQPLPTDKLQRPQQDKDDESKGKIRSCVIYYNGTFAPIHPGHVDTMKTAKSYLEQNGFRVLGVYLSPCWNGYLRNKMSHYGNAFISHLHRLQMCELASQV
ncbi:hypothetical protein RFI_32854 [Reticulomyxa filosa]|uniref:Cytidyltransferase-like domain-containing protein n=1 Tax=Reticulomyxa filosa TaxID=46433 RepID=X6LSD1_RETFI|nr:hypothetical protein RFI_32854 [Reticulomyxa filosa]|eukprot:ETO04544.1 hypothetical protein RFI_32854 [Reticulomyxa filosa]